MRKESNRTVYFMMSLLTHVAVAGWVTVAPELIPAPEGTTNMVDVEFTNLKTPEGQQIKTTDVGQFEAEAPVQPPSNSKPSQDIKAQEDPNAIAVAPIARKEMESSKVKEIQDSPKTKTITKAPEQKIEKMENTKDLPQSESLPEKMDDTKTLNAETKEVLPIETTETESAVAVATAAKLTKTQKDKKFEAERSREIFEKELDTAELNTKDETFSELDNSKEEYEELNSDEKNKIASDTEFEKSRENFYKEIDNEIEKAKKSEVESEDMKTLPTQEKVVARQSPEPKKESLAPAAVAQGLPQKANELKHESNMNYGVPSGVRDYRELMQTPGNIPPQYPELSRRKGEMGQVQLLYFVTADGKVASLQLVKSSGYVELDQEAVRSISKYRYQPGQQGYTSHTVNFILRGDAKAAGGTLRTSSNSQSLPTQRN